MFEQIIAFVTAPSVADALAQWIFAITSVVTAASAITALTPTRKDDALRSLVLKILNFLALNVGNAARREGGQGREND